MNEWKEYKLGEIADITMGQSPQGETCNSNGVGTPLLNGPTEFGIRFPAPVQFTTEGKKKCLVNDLLFCVRGSTTGRMNWADQIYAIGRGLAGIRHKNGPNYRYFLKGILDYHLPTMLAGATGSTFPNVSGSDLNELKIFIPPLPEQRAIASVLSSLDDKIDLLHRQNATLEALAETLFRQWFVEEAEESWEKGKLGDFVDLNPKRTLKSGSIAPYLEMSNVSNQVYHPDNWYDREFSSGTKFINGDTLLARITPCLENGKSAYVDFLEKEQVGWGSTEYIVMRPKPFLHTFFSYVLTRNEDFRSYAIASMVGSSGRQRVDINSLADYEISLPTHETIEKFNSFCEGSLQKMKHNHIEIRTLTNLRDTLLPKLMSGEVRVSETSNQA